METRIYTPPLLMINTTRPSTALVKGSVAQQVRFKIQLEFEVYFTNGKILTTEIIYTKTLNCM